MIAERFARAARIVRTRVTVHPTIASATAVV
jgi:hypothetical protein